MTIGLAIPYECYQCGKDYSPRFEWRKDDRRTWFCSEKCWTKYMDGDKA